MALCRRDSLLERVERATLLPRTVADLVAAYAMWLDVAGTVVRHILSAAHVPDGYIGMCGVAVSPLHVFAVDKYSHTLQTFAKSDGTRIRVQGSHGVDAVQFSMPNAVATDGTHVFVADRTYVRVFREADGAFVRRWGFPHGVLAGVATLAVDATRVFVADLTGNCVYVFPKAGGPHTHVLGDDPDGLGALFWPRAVAVDADHAYVVDAHNRVVVFCARTYAPLGCRPLHDTQGRARGSGPDRAAGQVTGLAVDADRLYVSDHCLRNVHVYRKFAEDIAFVRTIAIGGMAYSALALAVDADHLYVASDDDIRVFG